MGVVPGMVFLEGRGKMIINREKWKTTPEKKDESDDNSDITFSPH